MGGSLEDESQYKISRKQGHEHNYNLSKEKVQIIICQKNATKKKKLEAIPNGHWACSN